jgi:hypothetical protein
MFRWCVMWPRSAAVGIRGGKALTRPIETVWNPLTRQLTHTSARYSTSVEPEDDGMSGWRAATHESGSTDFLCIAHVLTR